MTFRLRGLLATSTFAFLTACGGGGGGGGGGGDALPPPTGSLSYVGATTPANLASAPAVPELPAWLLIELGISDSVGPGSIAVAAESAREDAAASSSVQKRLDRAKQLAGRFGKATAQEVTSEPCSGGGTAEFNDDGLRDDGTGTLIVTYRACVEDGAQLDGVFRFTVAAFDVGLQEPTDFTVSLENVTISSGSSSASVVGTVRTVLSVSSGITTSTHNTVARYSPQNVYTRLQDFSETWQALSPELASVSYQGRFYQSQHGYVDVRTNETLRQSLAFEYPVGGELGLTGAASSRVLMRFNAEDSTVGIAVDSDGNGTIERGLSGTYQNLLTANQNYAPFASAGADVTIAEGRSVTLDAAGSRDWENGTLTYSWSVTVPLGAEVVPPATGATFSFTPSEGGDYLVRLIVSDGQSTASDDVSVRVLNNIAPTANAGPDQWIFEREAVRLDASGSSDYEGDALQFTWARLAAPAGSAAPASFTGVTADLTTDLPGQYIYELRVADAAGSSTDYIQISVEPLLMTVYVPDFSVSWNTQLADTARQVQLRINPRYSGPPLALSITSNVPWLRIDTPNVTTASQTFSVSLDLPQLATLPNGNSAAVVQITPDNGFAPLQANVSMNMHLAILRQVSPYVVYTGQPTGVALYGDGMDAGHGRSLDVSGIEVQGLTDLMLVSGRIILPALAAGEYEVRVRNHLGIQFPPTRLLVRDAPSYPNEDVALSGAVQALEYDAERDVFYAVFANDGSYSAQRLVRQQDGSWRADPIDVSSPRAVTLTADGTQLLVTSANCGVHELDVATLAVLESTFKSNCIAEDYGIIHSFANGDVMIGDSDQWSTAWRYPDLQVIPYLPSIHSATAVLSYDRTRMIWAEGPSISAPREIYAFDTFMRGNAVNFAPHDTGTYFLRSNLAISGDGKRIMHREDVYDENLSYVGSLPGISGSSLLPALSRYGTRAAVLDPNTDTLSLFDVADGHTIALLQDIDTFASDVVGGRLLFFPDDSKVFAFTRTSTAHRLFVRQLP